MTSLSGASEVNRPLVSDLDAPTLKLHLMADKKTHLMVRDVSNLAVFALPHELSFHRKHALPLYMNAAEAYLQTQKDAPVAPVARTISKRVGASNDPTAQYDDSDEEVRDPVADQRCVALFLHRIPSLVTMGLVAQPRWCTLFNNANVSNVLVIYVNGVSYDEIAGCEVSKNVELPWGCLTADEQDMLLKKEADANADPDVLHRVPRRLNTRISDRILKPLRANKCSAVSPPEYAPVWVQSTQDNLEQEFFFRSMTISNRRPGQPDRAPQEEAPDTVSPPPVAAEPAPSKSAQALALFRSGKHADLVSEEVAVEDEVEAPHVPAVKDVHLETTLANMLHTLASSPSTLKSAYDRFSERYGAEALLTAKRHQDVLSIRWNTARSDDHTTQSFYEWVAAHAGVSAYLKAARAAGNFPKTESVLRSESGNLDNNASGLMLWTTGLITFAVAPDLVNAESTIPYLPPPLQPLSFNVFYNAPSATFHEAPSVDSISRLSGALDEQPHGSCGEIVAAKLEKLGFDMDIPSAEEGSKAIGEKRSRDEAPFGWQRLHMPIDHDESTVEVTCAFHVKHALDSLDAHLTAWVTSQVSSWNPRMKKVQDVVADHGPNPPFHAGLWALHKSISSDPSSLLAGLYCFAFDCEMVQGLDRVSLLARATLVHVPSGFVLVDALFRPEEEIVDYVTRFSGITASMLSGPVLPDTPHPPAAKYVNGKECSKQREGLWSLHHLQQLFQLLLSRTHSRKMALLEMWRNKAANSPECMISIAHVTRAVEDCSVYIMGHSLENDFKAAKIAMGCEPKGPIQSHSHHVATALRLVDTSFLYPHPGGHPYKNALRFLTQTFLRKRIQQGSHDSLEDAGVCAELALVKMLKGVEHGSSHRKQHIAHSIPVTLKSYPLSVMKGSPHLFAHPSCLSLETLQHHNKDVHKVLPPLISPKTLGSGHMSLLTYCPVASTVIVDRRSALRKVTTDCSRRNVTTVKDASSSNKVTDGQEIAKGGSVEEGVEKRNVHTPLFYGEDGHDRKASLWSEGVPPRPLSGGDVDAVSKIVSELKAQEESEDAYFAAAKSWELSTIDRISGYKNDTVAQPPSPPPQPPKPRLFWVQLSTSSQEFDSTATTDVSSHIAAVERLNERVLEVVEAAPQHTFVIVLAANCKEGNENKFSKAHGAMFAFCRGRKSQADISGSNDTSCRSYLNGVASNGGGCQHGATHELQPQEDGENR